MKKHSTITKHTSHFIDEMKEVLIKEKERLGQHLESLSQAIKTDPNTETEREYDLVDGIIQSSVDQSVQATLEKELRDIHKALERIQQSMYGICKYCDSAIEEDRLRARPTSSSCISCKKTLTEET